MFNKLINYVKASWAELRKVNWPTRSQATRLTVIVVVFASFLAVYIAIFDKLFRTLLTKFILKG